MISNYSFMAKILLAITCSGAVYYLLAERLSTHILLLVAISASYFPFYFDRSEYSHGKRYWHAAVLFFRPKVLGFFKSSGLQPRVILKNPAAYKDHKQVIFGSHPHGVMSFNHALLYMDLDGARELTQAIPLQMRRALGARSLFGVPILRDFVLMAGVVDASAPVASQCLKNGFSLTILPGGEQEQLLAQKDKHLIYVKNRKGFCKLAIKHEVPIVPAYCFGETSTFETSTFLLKQRKWLAKNFFIAVPFAWGNSIWNPFVPFHTPLTHCYGEPIMPPAEDKSLNYDEDLHRRVNILHQQYIDAILNLFNKNKAICGFPDAELTIV